MKTRLSERFLLYMACLLACAAACFAETSIGESVLSPVAGKPLWEIGLAGAVGRIPQYRGSEEYDTYVVPSPFLIYRGDLIRVNKDGIRGVVWTPEWGELDLSFYGNPPVHMNDARVGMPDLDPMVEAGPALKIRLARSESGGELRLLAAVRGVVSVNVDNLRTDYRGLRSAVTLQLSEYRFRPDSAWEFGGSIGVDIDDRWFNGYFYDVADAEAIPGRPAYKSHGGYGGVSLKVYATRPLRRNLTLGLYARWDNMDGTAYEDSPLVRSRNNVILGMGIAWTIAESEKLVRRSQ